MMELTDTSPENLKRLPGLFRRWELSEVLATCVSYRIEAAGTDADGTPLLAVYAGTPAVSETATEVPCSGLGDAADRVNAPPSLPRPYVESATSSKRFSQRDLAERWKLSVRTLERWRWLGTGPEYLRLNGRVLYRLDAIVAFEEERRRRITSGKINSGGRS